jgi:DsbC/DsbD-like thiol-disulfide interchange protein
MRSVLLFLVLTAAIAPAAAAETGWQELAPGTRVRLIASDKLSPEGKTLAAIELDLPPDTKTYWRVPGESGIAAELDIAGSTGVAASRFLWPYPQIEQRDNFTDFVFYGPTVIPVELEIDGDSASLEAELVLGVCSDICIPASASFSLPLQFDTPDAGQDLRIAQALATIPIGWTGDTAPVGEPMFDPAERLLWVPFDPAIVEAGSLIADAMKSGHLFGAPQKSPQPGLVSLPLLGGHDGADVIGQNVQIVFMTADGPYEVSSLVKASTAGRD